MSWRRTNRRPWWRLALGVLILLLGLYVLALAKPELVIRPQPAEPAERRQATSAMAPNSLYIPKINRQFGYQAGDASVLDSGGWHRYPERGQPGQGNFIVAAHRYELGLTPWQVAEQSPLYYIDRLSEDDEIIVKAADGELLTYEVESLREVAPTAVEIERETDIHQLTLYSCTEQGAPDGRVVVVARLAD